MPAQHTTDLPQQDAAVRFLHFLSLHRRCAVLCCDVCVRFCADCCQEPLITYLRPAVCLLQALCWHQLLCLQQLLLCWPLQLVLWLRAVGAPWRVSQEVLLLQHPQHLQAQAPKAGFKHCKPGLACKRARSNCLACFGQRGQHYSI